MCLDKQDEVVYYDPCESPEELEVIDQVMGLQDGGNPEVKGLLRQCRQLECRRGRVCARRAYLRNRKVGPGQLAFFPVPGTNTVITICMCVCGYH